MICNKELKMLNGHLRSHNMSMKEYREKYPETKLTCEESKNKMSNSRKDGIDSGKIKSWNVGLTAKTDERLAISGKNGGKTRKANWDSGKYSSYRTGKTKHTCESIKISSEKASITMKQKFVNNPELNPWNKSIYDIWTKKYGKETADDMWNERYKNVDLNIEKRTKTLRENIISGKTQNPVIHFKTAGKNTQCELKVKKFLDDNKIGYVQQHHLCDKELKKTKVYDFYLPMYDLLIEVDGNYWHCKLDRKPKNWEEIRDNDVYKNQLAMYFGYRLLRISEDDVSTLNLEMIRGF